MHLCNIWLIVRSGYYLGPSPSLYVCLFISLCLSLHVCRSDGFTVTFEASEKMKAQQAAESRALGFKLEAFYLGQSLTNC